jgi:tetratricopeptide (TPR) repeat protein
MTDYHLTPHPTDALSSYLDDELEPVRRGEIDAHLAVCGECTSALDELRAVVATATGLESRPPERDLWLAIEARLTPRGEVVGGSRSRRWWSDRTFALTLPQLAAAASVMVLLSGAGAWLVLRSAVRPPVGGSMAGVSSPIGSPASSGAAFATFDTRQYDSAVADLQSALEQNRSRLDPATIRTVERNLKIIDQAIEEARKALDADPSNPYLNGHVAEQMRRKIRVLRQATDAVAAVWPSEKS